MSLIKRIYYYLGSSYVAILLISLAALAVIAGTLIESYTDSHLQAVAWTYGHPWFAVLLWMFFINILFSALHRWPFKWRHIPFLITHLGLLMIIGGTIVKNKIGLQGNLTLLEGAATQTVHLSGTHALQIENKGTSRNLPFNPDAFQKTGYLSDFPELAVKILKFYPHVQEEMHTWIKNDRVHIFGQKSLLPVYLDGNSLNLPEFTELYFEGYSEPWDVLAMRTNRLQDLIREIYLEKLNVKITSKRKPGYKINSSLKKMLASPTPFSGGEISVGLYLDFFEVKDAQPQIKAVWQSKQSDVKESVFVNLQGVQALLNLSENNSKSCEAGFNLDLFRAKPMLVIVEDENDDIHLLFFDRYGRFKSNLFSSKHFESLVVYDGGYGGYAVQAKLPFPSFETSRADKERSIEKMVMQEIGPAMKNAAKLAPSLKLLKKACNKTGNDLANVFVTFLSTWRSSGQLLYSGKEMPPQLKEVLQNLEWEENHYEHQACRWVSLLFERLEGPISQGENIGEFLKANRWPFACPDTRTTNLSELLTELAQQIFAVSQQLPSDSKELSSLNDQARLLSAFFMADEIDYRFLHNYPLHVENEYELFSEYREDNSLGTIETSLACSFIKSKPPSKIEDRQPCVIAEFALGKHKERIALAYNPKGLKWPVLNGRYRVRYQSESIEIPYRIRLRQAREIHYPQTQQPYSYESDILISDAAGNSVLKTLSMNDVYETWDGYRFYLSGIGSLSNPGIKYIQVAVNLDPAKYWLTYPGGVIVFIGIILLFWFKPKNRNLE